MKRIFVYIVAAVQIVLGLSPFIPSVRTNIWAAQTSVNSFASMLATYIAIQFTCFGLLVYLLLQDFNDQAEAKLEVFRQYTPLTVRRLKENEFYRDFLGCSIKAKHYVNICYFAPRPPKDGANEERIDYYKNMVRLMKRTPNVRFRRIVRDTPENRAWVKQLVRGLRNTTNCYIRMLSDLEREVAMPLALSVQVVDGELAWLVAVSEHSGASLYRDLAIENSEVVGFLDKYFQRLWDLSRVVFEPGLEEARSHRAIDEDIN